MLHSPNVVRLNYVGFELPMFCYVGSKDNKELGIEQWTITSGRK